MLRISLATIIGIVQLQTLTRSTHNFIDVNVAKKLNLFVYPAANLRVMASNDKRINGFGKCHKAKLQLNDYELESSFYIVPLGVDVVLVENHCKHWENTLQIIRSNSLSSNGLVEDISIWIPTNSYSNCICTTNERTYSKRSTNIYHTMSTIRIINYKRSSIPSSKV